MNLSAEQKRVVVAQENDILVIAGAGSGKTHTLVHRIAQIGTGMGTVMITFTNAAAAELKARIQAVFPAFEPYYAGTLHGFCLKLIQDFPGYSGYRSGVMVMDQEASEDLLKNIAKALKYKGSIKDLHMHRNNPHAAGGDGSLPSLVVKQFRSTMLENNVIDFDEILRIGLKVIVAKEGRVGVVSLYVDEFQDSSNMDDSIYQAIQCKSKFFVGDPDQAIYSFRGGDVNNILSVHVDKRFLLQENYRSVEPICALAQGLIENNQHRINKATIAVRKEPLRDIATQVNTYATAEEELRAIVLDIMRRAATEELKGFAVLCRTNALVDRISTVFRSMGMETRQKVQDLPKDWKLAKAMVNFLLKPFDDTLAERLLALETTPENAYQVKLECNSRGLSINKGHYEATKPATWRLLLKGIEMRISPASVALLAEAWTPLAENASPAALTTAMIEIGTGSHEEGHGVTVTTIHGAKGREWDNVYLPAWEQEIFPGKKTGKELEEERRLGYVAITRARNRVLISWAKTRQNSYTRRQEKHEPSQFLRELGAVK